METRAYRALYHDTPGIALRDSTGRVSFIDDATGLWRTLTDADAPLLTLLGRLDLIEAQRLADACHGTLYQWINDRNTEHAKLA